MSRQLVPCASCRRHVASTCATCPFCGVSYGALLEHRGLMVAGAVTLATLIAGCPDKPAEVAPEPTQTATSQPTATVAPPPTDPVPTAQPTAEATTAPTATAVATASAAPPATAAPTATAVASATGTPAVKPPRPATKYGMPPRPMAPKYGMPPTKF